MKGYVEIFTPRLWMRPYQLKDIEALHRILIEPRVRKYLLDDQIVSKTWVAEEIERNAECFQNNGCGQWGLWLKDKQELIGLCGFRFFFEPPELQLIYALAPMYWGQGLATEALKATIQYGFEKKQFQQIIGSTNILNVASARLMEKVGMRFFKQIYQAGQDLIYFSISDQCF